jgi:hypothetical protein
MAGKKKRVYSKQSANALAQKETKLKREMLKWADDLAEKVIQIALEDAALRLHDNIDDEEEVDLHGEFDPIVDEKTGAKLSDVIQEFAANIKQPERFLRRIYLTAVKKKWGKQKIPTDPTGESYGAYLVNRHGVWWKLRVGTGLEGLYVWRRIARTRIVPVAMSRDTTRQRNWRRHYAITDETGEFAVEIGAEKLAKKADPAITALVRCGVHVVETDDARQHFAKFLRFKPFARIIRAPKTGWFEPKEDLWVFVLPSETLTDEKINIILDLREDANDRQGFHRSGTAQQWRKEIAAPLASNSNVILAVGVFLAAPLLRWADEPGGGFHLYGPSKIGKSLAGAIGQSIWGQPYAPGTGNNAFGFTWESTANRIGQRAVLRSDVGLYLDEIGIGDQKAIASAVYKLAGGLDKGRFGQAERNFSILFLSTGESSLAEFLQSTRPGQLVRLVDIPAAVQPDSAFETVAKNKIAPAARRFYAATKEYHGEAGYDWLRHLVTLGPRRIKAELQRIRQAWLALPQVAEIASRAHPQVVSVINRFTLVAAALHMAVEAKILPWTRDDIDVGMIACMQRWLNQRGNIDAGGDLLREIQRRREMFAATISDRFVFLRVVDNRIVPISKTDQLKLNAAHQFDGFVKNDRILVWPKTWERWWAGLDADAVKEQLRRVHLLIGGHNGEVPCVERFQSGIPAARFYVLASTFFDDVTA